MQGAEIHVRKSVACLAVAMQKCRRAEEIADIRITDANRLTSLVAST
jgi:hypothetical protein